MEIKILEQKPGRHCEAISALFEKDGKWYYADLANLPLYGNECMIFQQIKMVKLLIELKFTVIDR